MSTAMMTEPQSLMVHTSGTGKKLPTATMKAFALQVANDCGMSAEAIAREVGGTSTSGVRLFLQGRDIKVSTLEKFYEWAVKYDKENPKRDRKKKRA